MPSKKPIILKEILIRPIAHAIASQVWDVVRSSLGYLLFKRKYMKGFVMNSMRYFLYVFSGLVLKTKRRAASYKGTLL